MVKSRKTAVIWVNCEVTVSELASLIAKELDWPADPLAKHKWAGPGDLRMQVDVDPAIQKTSRPARLKDGMPVSGMRGIFRGFIVYENQYIIRVVRSEICSELALVIKVRKGKEALAPVVERLAREIQAMAKSLKE